MKVQDILTDESKWTRGAYARAGSEVVESNDPRADCFCLAGALFRAYPVWDDYMLVALKINAALREKFGHHGVEWFNDAPNRTFAEVRGLIEELDI